jgi:hypothetical protein
MQIGNIEDAVSDFTAVITDANSPLEQRYIAHMNRAEISLNINPSNALCEVEAALNTSAAPYSQTLRLRCLRA